MTTTTERTEIFNISIDKFYQVIADYKSYPEFVDGVSAIKIVEQSGNESTVEYSLNLIKKFSYKLKLTESKPDGLSWELIDGDIFKFNSGSWHLKDLGSGKTEVTYKLEVEFKGFAPKMVVNKLVANNLPAMMKSYYERALEL
jgi:coenzyme Q-binding protein COQ10